MNYLQQLWSELRGEANGLLGPLRARCTALIERFEDFTASNLQLGEYHLRHENYADAALRFRLALWRQPKNVEALAGLALSLALGGEPEKAQKPLKAALKLQPDNTRALTARVLLEPGGP